MSYTGKCAWILSLLACFFLISCGTKELRIREYSIAADTPDPAKPSDESYVIGPGDLIGVVVWKEPDLSNSVKVRPDGFVTLALLNEVQVVGLTTARFRELLEEKYKEFIATPYVSVKIETVNSSEIFLIGRVVKPAGYPATGRDTLLQLITRAGGLTMFADSGNIKVVRREDDKVTEFIVDYEAILKTDLKQDILLKPGDRIIVP